MPSLRAVAAQALKVARRLPAVHRAVHAGALLVIKTRWGERFVRSVLTPEAQTDAEYRDWIARNDTLTDADRSAIGAHIARMIDPPLISVLMPAHAAPEALLRAAIASVRAQLYPHWELCIADDGSPGEAVWRVLSEAAAQDPRIKIVRRPVNGGISAATNSALALAAGEFVAFMDHDDLIPEHALYHVAAALEARPDADLVYSDEDKIDERGLRSQPHFKTDWNYELMLGQNAVNHLAVVRRSLVAELGGLRSAFDGAQDWDLVLRVCERTTPERIVHIPWVLYHWRWQGRQGSFSRRQLDRCAEAGRRAVAEHLARTGQAGLVERLKGAGPWLRVRRPLPSPAPLVSILVPTRDRAGLLAQCAAGVLEKTSYGFLELIVIDNGSEEPETLALFEQLARDPRVRILPAPMPFNYSALINRGVAAAQGEIVVQLNNDISVTHPDWLSELVSHAVRPNVGAVGARLLYPDGSVQHAGVALGLGAPQPVAGHLYPSASGSSPGYQGHLALTRNVSAVTGACLAMRKAVYEQVGGMDEAELAVAFNDVDLCLKVRAAGYDIVWTPFAELIHHESASRGSDLAPEARARFQREIDAMRRRWGAALDTDPFYGAVFDRLHANYRLADPPLRTPPWEAAQASRVPSRSQAR